MSEDSTKAKPEGDPSIGTLKVKYGKSRVHQARCLTCVPEWRGAMESRQAKAFEAAVLHAIEVHKRVPHV